MAKVRAVLALVVLGLFPVVVLGLLAGLLAAAVWMFSFSGPVAVKILGWVALPLLFAVGVAVREASRARPTPLEGPELHRDDHPALWGEIDALAEGLGTDGPARVVVDDAVNAGVRQLAGERELVVGLPLLVGLTVAQLRAVLAHELGHYGAGHTAASQRTYRASEVVLSAVENASGLLRWVLSGYARLYMAVAAASNRDCEREADSSAARVAGPADAAAALRRTLQLDAAWQVLVEDYLPLAGPAQRRPRVVTGLRALLEARDAELRQLVDEEVASPSKASWSDMHPPLGRRIAAFEALLTTPPGSAAPSAGDSDDKPAWSLLGHGEETLERLEAQLLHDTDPVAEWDELVALAGARVVADTAGALTRAAQQSGEAAPASLDNLLRAVEHGRGGALVTPLVNPALHPEDRPEAEREVLADVLGAAVVHSLVEIGRARYVLDWTGPWRLVADGPDGEHELDVEALIGPAVADPRAVPALRGTLAGLCVPLSHQPPSAPVPDPVPVGVLLQVKGPDKKPADVLVCDSGLLVLPAQRAKLSTAGLRQITGATARARAQRVMALLEEGPVALRDRPATRWVDTDEIVTGRLAVRPWGWSLSLTLTTGEELSMRSTSETDEDGDAYVGIHELIGARTSKHPVAAAG